MTDFSQLEKKQEQANDGVWMEVEDPRGAPMGVHLLLAGIDSDHYNKQLRKHQDKMLNKKNQKMSADEAENFSIELLTACTLNWEGVEYDGVALECNKDNVRWLYRSFGFIRDQVDDFIGDRSNFLAD